MRYSLSTAALVAAMTVSEVAARPSLRHRHIHTKRGLADVDWSKVNYDLSGVDWSKVDYTGKSATAAAAAAAATPADTSAPVVNVASAAADSVSSLVDDLTSTASNTASGLWKNLVGASNDRTSFGSSVIKGGATGDFYSGEIGSPYGSNMMKVDAVGDYDHTNTFVNEVGTPITMVLWNKVGRPVAGQENVLSGSTSATTDPALTFVLQPGESQVVAFMDDTQYGFAQATNDILISGQFDTTFGECNTVKGGDTCNVSAIPNEKGNTYVMSISNTGNDCVSSNEENCWYLDTQAAGCTGTDAWSKLECTKTLNGKDGLDRNGSCYVNTGKGNFVTKMGGQK